MVKVCSNQRVISWSISSVQLLDNEVAKSEENEEATNTKSRKKRLTAVYDADKRSHSWMKLKKDYVNGLGDTLDLIPIGAWYGNGRKAQWWSPILLGVWSPETDRIVAVCKCMSGM